MSNYTFTNNDGIKYKIYRKIHISPDLPPKREMAVMMEEVFHAFFWDVPEKKVRRFCSTLTNILHKDGWRQTVVSKED